MTKPIDLDELERLRAVAENSHDAPEHTQRFNEPMLAWFTALDDAFPALLAELRARRRQVEVAIGGLSSIENQCGGPGCVGHQACIEARCTLREVAALDPAAPAKGGEGEP